MVTTDIGFKVVFGVFDRGFYDILANMSLYGIIPNTARKSLICNAKSQPFEYFLLVRSTTQIQKKATASP